MEYLYSKYLLLTISAMFDDLELNGKLTSLGDSTLSKLISA